MQDATFERDLVQRTLTSFICDHEAGRDPDPAAYARRAPSAESRAELEHALEEYLDLSELLGQSSEARIGPYRIEGELGRGGMARVYEVWDTDLNRSLAMKVSRKVRLNVDGTVPPGQEREVARFLQEAQITSQLRHPGIVPVHQLGVDERGHVFFTMQLIEEETLGTIFSHLTKGEGGWTRPKVLGVLLKACEAVAFAHSRGVIHRDLKPQNVMVGRFGEVYVLDWGLAKLVDEEAPTSLGLFLQGSPAGRTIVTEPWTDDVPGEPTRLTRSGSVVGTPAYMAPEQAREERAAVGKHTDVYAMGAILYELLTGRAPFQDAGSDGSGTRQAVLERVSSGPPRSVTAFEPHAPAELVAICEKAMAHDVRARYASMVELKDDLQAFLERRAVKAYATGPLVELRMWVQRNRAVAASVAAVVLTVAVALAGWLHLREEQHRAALLRSDRGELFSLNQEVRELWPIRPDRVPNLERWIERAQGLAGRREEHALWLERGGEPVAAGFLTQLATFADPELGPIPQMEDRLDQARTIKERSVTGSEARILWAQARAAIIEDPRYGLDLEPQIGLLPLGPDPKTELWEFADLQTGDPPLRDADGRLIFNEETGLVLVLIPGGTDWLGVQSEFPSGQNYVAPDAEGRGGAVRNEELREVEVSAFLLSKFEMTQGQWLRVTGENPSQFGPGSAFENRVTDLTHPVELVEWGECRTIFARLGLRLPSEDEWEYAARAGTDTPWSSGPSKESLRGYANLADLSIPKAGLPTNDWEDWPDNDDGDAWHAPVDDYLPNPFGLHNVHGNVFEWCRDGWAISVQVVGPELRVVRGGAWNNKAAYLGSGYRIGAPPTLRRSSVGVRPARDL